MVRGDAILYRVCLPPSQSGAIALWNRAIYFPHKTTTGIVAIGGLEIPPPLLTYKVRRQSRRQRRTHADFGGRYFLIGKHLLISIRI